MYDDDELIYLHSISEDMLHAYACFCIRRRLRRCLSVCVAQESKECQTLTPVTR